MSTDKRYGLGIDTGGTYTDAVIVDLGDIKVLAKRKAKTTHHDLSIGLLEAVEAVFAEDVFRPSDISLIGISTTLATNSILEGHGGEVGLILIGWEPLEQVHFQEKAQVHVRGGYDPKGQAKASLDMEEVRKAIDTVGKGVDAIAISGLFSIANASQERTVKRLARDMTGLPVVAGHELSAELGIALRTETAVLNGKLIPRVNEFFDDLEDSFARIGLKAPIMIYKGDGSVMSIEVARERPVETILSGPAASAMGGKELAGVEDGIIVDIGGTSTDIAVLEEGFPMIMHEGANVGNWRTRVKAVDMMTVALGGDSRVHFERQVLSIGPDRVLPLSMLPPDEGLKERMVRQGITQFYMIEEGEAPRMNDNEQKVYDALLGRGPMTSEEIRDATKGLWVIEPHLTTLRQKGILVMAALTPTDFLHHQGLMSLGNKDMADAGVRAMAGHMRMEPGQLAAMVMEEVKRLVSSSIMRKLLQDEFGGWDTECEQSAKLVHKVTRPEREGVMRLEPRCKLPIIGVGAPASLLMDDLDKRMGADVLFPPDYEVGNAVGAVCSKVMESLSATVSPTINFTYLANVPFIGPMEYNHFDSAVESCKASLTRHLKAKVESSGGTGIKVYSKLKVHRAIEGGWGAWEGEGSRGMNYADITVRVVADPPLPDI